jgi:hypothetical protein
MNAKIVCLFGLILLCHAVRGQSPAYLEYDKWETSPSIHKLLDPPALEYPAVVILHNRVIELSMQGGQAITFDSEHKIVHVNNDAGIERFNKVYIPLYGGRELVSIKVRSIDKDGKVTTFNSSNLKELKNVEGYGNFKIFAIEGLSKEGELEYAYTLRTSPQTAGRVTFQQDIPVQEANLHIVFPERFSFLSKSYNGLPSMESSYLEGKRKALSVSKKDIPALIDEQYAAYKPNLMKVDFKLESNGYEVSLMSWGSISEKLIRNLYDNGAESKVAKLIKLINVDGLEKVEQVRKVERYIKTNFTVKEGNSEAYENLKEIIANHVGNERGMVKLYMSIFHLLEIQNLLVFTCSRKEGFIDPLFANLSDLDEVLLYFPDNKSYLIPKLAYTRLGAAQSFVAGSNALFITYYFPSDKAEYLKYTIKPIESLDYTLNNEGVRAQVTFSPDLSELDIEQENFWQGYRASFYRGIYYYRPEAKREEFFKDLILSGVDNYSIIKRTVEGEDIELSSKPENYLTVKTHYKVSSLVEKAGDDYLVSIGKIIGKQSELYQEKTRQMDIVFHEVSDYTHEIVLNIPPNYKCTGLESIKINNKVVQKGEDVMYFSSDYALEGNRLTIKVKEVYKVLDLPLSTYDEFRKMINSAADFSKVALVLQTVQP